MRLRTWPGLSSSSGLRQLAAPWKLAALAVGAVGVLCLHQPGPCLAALLGSLFLVLGARLPLRGYLQRLAIVGVALGPFLLWLLLVPEASQELSAPTWPTPARLLAAGRLACKALALLHLLLALGATTSAVDLGTTLHAWHIPAGLIHVGLLTYRYFFLLQQEWRRLRLAMRVRGFRPRLQLHSYRTLGQAVGTLLVRSADRAERVGQALRCRGFDGRFRSLHRTPSQLRDRLFFLLVTAATLAVVTWDLMTR